MMCNEWTKGTRELNKRERRERREGKQNQEQQWSESFASLIYLFVMEWSEIMRTNEARNK